MSSGSVLKRVRFQGGSEGAGSQARNYGRSWLDSEGRFLFGKHGPTAGLEGESIERVRREDPGYLRWIVECVEDICEEDRDIIAAALRRRG